MKNDFSKTTQTSTATKYTIEVINGVWFDPRPTYKKVGAYRDEAHLFEELAEYPRICPCPKIFWDWQDKELCYKTCPAPPKECIYFHVAKYEVQYA